MDNTSLSAKAVAPDQKQDQDKKSDAIKDGTEKSSLLPPTSISSRYIRDFEGLFVPVDVDRLREKALNGHLRDCQFRSLCWRYFLRCLPDNYDKWLVACKESRSRYDELRSKHLSRIKPALVQSQKSNTEIEEQSNSNNQSAKVPIAGAGSFGTNDNDEQAFIKASKECDYKNTYRTIERDVVRTFPDMDFFRQTEMQDILGNILFNFASENRHISYKQGMHELLATLLYVAYTDSQNCLINYEGGYANDSIATLLDLKYLEHDVYHLFSALMKSIEGWYQNDEMLVVPDPPANHDRRDNDYYNRIRSSRTTTSGQRHQVNSVLGLKLKKISENIVRKHDLELFNHLEALQIAPQIYGIRWMRLLFGREYEFLDLLAVWDAIICDKNSMSLIDYVFASMLITIREELINGDYTDCLNNLMRHQFKDVPYVIRLALHLRDPVNNIRPQTTRYQFNNFPKATGVSSSLSSHNFRSSLRMEPSATSSSLTSKFSQQYINDKRLQSSTINEWVDNYVQPSGSGRYAVSSTGSFNRDKSSDAIFTMSSNQDKRNDDRTSRSTRGGPLIGSVGYLAQQATNPANYNMPVKTSTPNAKSGSSKFLPNINRIVSSIGQNIQEKALPMNGQSGSIVQWHSAGSLGRSTMSKKDLSSNQSQRLSGSQHKQFVADPQSKRDQTRAHNAGNQAKMQSSGSAGKNYEMREMLPINSAASSSSNRRLQLPTSSGGLDVSNESYDDLHSIVGYCWRLLSEQIDSLQRCLPKEKSLHSEDEIFVALAQLKKVRDVLKGSLRLEDELETTNPPTTTAAPTTANQTKNRSSGP